MRQLLALIPMLLLISGCERHDQIPASPGQTTTPPKSSAKNPPASTAPPVSAPPINKSQAPEIKWARLGDKFDSKANTRLVAHTSATNRLEIHTENVRSLTLDLNQLPPGISTRGPWNLQIDQQGIELTGRRGRILKLVRSPAGNWTVAESP